MYIKRILLTVALLGLVVMGFFSYYIYKTILIPNTAFEQERAQILIPTNTSKKELLEIMEPLVKNIKSLELVADKKSYSNNIRPGRYILEKDMSNMEIVDALRSKNRPISLKFNNQERLENLAGHVSRQLEADSLSLINTMRDTVFLKENNMNVSNALALYIPNTYEFYWNTSAEQFRDRMKKENERFWNERRQKAADDLGFTREEVISLAAIVQKETAKVDERAKVAGVYLNRLKINMKLQADPTVIYAKKHEENDFEQMIKRVLYSHLEIESSYNTYQNHGIPQGVITMPDISSIDGVLFAEQHDYLYFVADTSNFGYHIFAKNYAEHNRNKRQYIEWVSKQKQR